MKTHTEPNVETVKYDFSVMQKSKPNWETYSLASLSIKKSSEENISPLPSKLTIFLKWQKH